MRHYLRDPTFSRFDTIPECDRHTHTHTDRQTDRHTTTAYTTLSKASRGKNLYCKKISVNTIVLFIYLLTNLRLYKQMARQCNDKSVYLRLQCRTFELCQTDVDAGKVTVG